MAGRSLASSVSLGTIPRWAALIGIIVVSRTVSTALMLWFAAAQKANAWTGAQPDLFEFSRIWDAHWYRIIAEVGYPTELPVTGDGSIGENAWAFMPIYPFVVRGLMGMTGLPFAVVSVFLSLIAFATFIFLADRVFRHIVGDRAALWAVAVIAFSPVSPVYQVGYAESLGMVFLALVLLGLVEKRWALVALAIPLAALTRPLGAPIALMLFVLVILKWRSNDRAPLAWLTVLAGASTAAWPAIAWMMTGRMTAYFDTELAWRRPYLGTETSHVWGTGWWDSANWWFADNAVWVILAVAFTTIACAALPSTRRLGRVALAWCFGYLAYLVLVLFPQSSIFRLLAPMWPLAGSVARSRAASIVAVAFGVVGQFVWLDWCWSVQGSDWTPP